MSGPAFDVTSLLNKMLSKPAPGVELELRINGKKVSPQEFFQDLSSKSDTTEKHACTDECTHDQKEPDFGVADEDDVEVSPDNDKRITFGFVAALLMMKRGRRVARERWPEGVYVYLVPGSEFNVNREPINKWLPNGTPVSYDPHFDIYLGEGRFAGFVFDDCDILAEDWYLVD